MNQAATEQENQDLNATQRLLALQLLSKRKQRLEQQDKAQRHKWREELDKCTRAMNELIEDHVPTDGEECRDHLSLIKEAYETRKKAENDKKAELDATKAATAQVESAMFELIHASDEDVQMNLDLGDEERESWLTNDTGLQIQRALTDATELGDATSDMQDLRSKLEDLGVAGLQLAPEADEDDDEDATDSE